MLIYAANVSCVYYITKKFICHYIFCIDIGNCVVLKDKI